MIPQTGDINLSGEEAATFRANLRSAQTLLDTTASALTEAVSLDCMATANLMLAQVAKEVTPEDVEALRAQPS